MSYDLFVWHSASPATVDDAETAYPELTATGVIPAHPQVAAFYRELTERYPEIDTVPEDDLDRCPWSVALSVADTPVVMCMSWSFVKEVDPVVLAPADRHGLVLYNPQSRTVRNPGVLRRGPGRTLAACDGSLVPDPDEAAIARVLRGLSPDNWNAVLEERDDRYVQVGFG